MQARQPQPRRHRRRPETRPETRQERQLRTSRPPNPDSPGGSGRPRVNHDSRERQKRRLPCPTPVRRSKARIRRRRGHPGNVVGEAGVVGAGSPRARPRPRALRSKIWTGEPMTKLPPTALRPNETTRHLMHRRPIPAPTAGAVVAEAPGPSQPASRRSLRSGCRSRSRLPRAGPRGVFATRGPERAARAAVGAASRSSSHPASRTN